MSITHTQIERRRKGIGGSDAPVVMGLSKWRTPFELWQEKRGVLESSQENEAMRWGQMLEPLVRQRYADETGHVVTIPDTLVHPTIPHMIAHVDGITASGRVLEIKTARDSRGWGEPGTDEIPPAYIVQVQHYLAVTGAEIADIAALLAGQDFRIYSVPRNQDLIDMIIDQEGAFWEMVQRETPPPPISFADAVAQYHTSRAGEIVATTDELMAVEGLRELKKLEAAQKIEKEALKIAIAITLGDRDTLTDADGNVLATWKSSKPPRVFDEQAFKAAHPDLYAHFLTTRTAARRFLIK